MLNCVIPSEIYLVMWCNYFVIAIEHVLQFQFTARTSVSL